MISLKLPLAAAVLALGVIAPAQADTVVHHRTVVANSVEVHPMHARHVHERHKVCKNIWRNHHRVHSCRMVKWNA